MAEALQTREPGAWAAAVAVHAERVACTMPALADVAHTALRLGVDAVRVLDDSPARSSWRLAIGAAAEIIEAESQVSVLVCGFDDATSRAPIGCLIVDTGERPEALLELHRLAWQELMPRVLVLVRPVERTPVVTEPPAAVRAFNKVGGMRRLAEVCVEGRAVSSPVGEGCFLLRVDDHPASNVVPFGQLRRSRSNGDRRPVDVL
jgi:hypothetical protein